SGILLWVCNLAAGIAICWIYARGRGVKEGFFAVAIISLIHGGGELVLAPFTPALAAFVPAIIAVGALFALGRTKRYSRATDLDKETKIFRELKDEGEERPNVSLHQAFMPYYFLAVVAVVILGIQPIANLFNKFALGFPFPEVSTGYGYVVEAVDAYSPIKPLTNPAFFLLAAFVFAYYYFKHLGLMEKGKGKQIFLGLKNNALGVTFAITGFLGMAMIMRE